MNLKEFNQWYQDDKALKSILISIDEAHVRSLHSCYIGHAVLTLTMLRHSHATHSNITGKDLENIDARLKHEYGSITPLETPIYKVEDVMHYAAIGKSPYTKKKIVNTAWNLEFSTGAFNDQCK